jgi:hypothetical protein
MADFAVFCCGLALVGIGLVLCGMSLWRRAD